MQPSKAGINHIEFWVNDLKQSLQFYTPFFNAIGWNKLGDAEFSSGATVIYLVEHPSSRSDVPGPRHICFQAATREVVDALAKLLAKAGAIIIRGPVEMPEYSAGYYTVDLRDPDGYVLEVAHTPNMKF